MDYPALFAEIRRKLSELARLDADCKIFGADQHQYRLNPPIAADNLEQIETQMGCQLPDQYRRFVLELGDGGAGPYYGIFPFAELLKNSPTETIARCRQPFPVPNTSRDMKSLGYWPPGALAISDMGCCATCWLVVSGAERGFVWWQSPDAEWGPALSDDTYVDTKFSEVASAVTDAAVLNDPWTALEIGLDAPASLRLQFLDWYVKWLDDSLGNARKTNTNLPEYSIMEMTAHQRRFGVNEDDEPFTFLWTHDDDLDFVFSLTRPLDDNDNSPIDYMVLDQIWEPVADFNCRIDNDYIRAGVPASLREYTSNSDEIVVRHCCDGDSLRKLIEVLQSIFKGKSGLQVQVQ